MLAAGLTQEMAVASTRHPASSRKMAVMDAPGALWLLGQINTEENFNHLAPIRAVVGGVKQAHIELDVFPIVFGEFVWSARFRQTARSSLASSSQSENLHFIETILPAEDG